WGAALKPVPQAQLIKGKVTEAETNTPLPGVNVIIKGSLAGTTTDADGRYEIDAVGAETTLVFSFVGYDKQEVLVGNQTVINVQMAVDQKSLDEVVIVGYGTQRKSDLTGAVATVSSEEITQLPVATLQEGMQGRVPGVQISQSSGAPGANPTV